MIESSGFQETLDLAARIGAKLRGGEVIELASDLGGGKTTFVKGLARGMGIQEIVKSPSFTIANSYDTGALRLCHFDFYRLEDPGVMRSELAESIADPASVVVVEWADIVDDVLPAGRMRVTIRVTGEQSRTVRFDYPETLSYLL